MKLNQLRYFLEVSRLRNMTEAAKTLYISQPSLTVAIRKLEQELGVILFHRSRQGVRLTEEGAYFLRKAEPLVQSLDQLQTEMLAMGGKNRSIRIGVPPMMGSFLFPRLFTGFRARNPGVKVEIAEHGTYKILQMLLDGKLDASFLIRESYQDKSLHFEPLLKRHFRVFFPESHPLAHRTRLTAEDLRDVPLILLNEEFYTHRVVMDFFGSKAIAPDIVLETTQLNTVKRFIKEQVAASILLEDSLPESEGFRSLPLEAIAPVTVALAWRRDRLMTAGIRALQTHIRQVRSDWFDSQSDFTCIRRER